MMQITMPKRKRKPETLSEKLIAWKHRIAQYLGVDVLYQSEAAELLRIPVKTYKNYEPTLRRQPNALAVAELERRMDQVETQVQNYINSGAKSGDVTIDTILDCVRERAP